jgi:AcrR family transcriptional regulator
MPVVSDEHRAEVRAKIVATAAELIRRDGPNAATTRAVQEAAGVSTGTIYRYFPNAAALVAAAGQEITQQDWDNILGALDPNDPDSGLRQVIREVVLGPPETAPERIATVLLRTNSEAGSDGAAATTSYNRFVVEAISPIATDAQEAGHLQQAVDVEAMIELLDMVRDAMTVRAAQDSYATSHARVGAMLTRFTEAACFTQATSADAPADT